MAIRDVSIHAPARGATLTASPVVPKCIVSIHAPARGATNPDRFSDRPGDCFNSRSREGSDRAERPREGATDVSIHAPARGATSLERILNSRSQVSIHAPARGATSANKANILAQQFQFTLPRGERQHILSLIILTPISFNSRSREGSDKLSVSVFRYISSFNSRSREGSDRTSYILNLVTHVSIHAPARGATVVSVCSSDSTSCFNSRSREGSDKEICAFSDGLRCFNSRSREGSDVSRNGVDVLQWMFQFTLPRGERHVPPMYST